jgi:hypothetical protein
MPMEVIELGISISLAPAQALQVLQTVTASAVLAHSITPQTCTILFITLNVCMLRLNL